MHRIFLLAAISLTAHAGEQATGEPLLFTGEDAASAKAELARVPSKMPRLTSATREVVFEAGRDFTWEPGSRTVRLVAGSRVPFKREAELYPAPNSPNAYKQRRDGKSWMLFGAGRFFHDMQCAADYESGDAWRAPEPQRAPDGQLGKLRAKLAAKAPLKVVMLGDSISTGADASALAKAPPFQQGYPELVAQGLRAKTEVKLVNLSVGGMDSAWGVTRVQAVIAEKPDLLLVAFGMNDASGRRKAEDFAAKTRAIFEPVRAALPECEVILVSCMTANSEWVHSAPELYGPYAAELGKLAGPGVAFADVNAVWTAWSGRKKHLDLSGNGLNHPNDFGHRLYAEAILAVIGK